LCVGGGVNEDDSHLADGTTHTHTHTQYRYSRDSVRLSFSLSLPRTHSLRIYAHTSVCEYARGACVCLCVLSGAGLVLLGSFAGTLCIQYVYTHICVYTYTHAHMYVLLHHFRTSFKEALVTSLCVKSHVKPHFKPLVNSIVQL
jgi:hypothetical protein